jgi:hypothetical protein
MEDFIIKSTEDTPEISFQLATNTYSIKGKSFPENPSEFYFPIYKQLEELINTAKELTIEANLKYINSSSVKMIFAFFNLLNAKFKSNSDGNYKIVWQYSSSDKIMQNKGKEFKEFLDLPFELSLQN